tara:strand:- start:389 stop:523 length:135 start_codon:yes stop_codon:yes gene_type:complete
MIEVIYYDMFGSYATRNRSTGWSTGLRVCTRIEPPLVLGFEELI